jgi:hypothetical protein
MPFFLEIISGGGGGVMCSSWRVSVAFVFVPSSYSVWEVLILVFVVILPSSSSISPSPSHVVLCI